MSSCLSQAKAYYHRGIVTTLDSGVGCFFAFKDRSEMLGSAEGKQKRFRCFMSALARALPFLNTHPYLVICVLSENS